MPWGGPCDKWKILCRANVECELLQIIKQWKLSYLDYMLRGSKYQVILLGMCACLHQACLQQFLLQSRIGKSCPLPPASSSHLCFVELPSGSGLPGPPMHHLSHHLTISLFVSLPLLIEPWKGSVKIILGIASSSILVTWPYVHCLYNRTGQISILYIWRVVCRGRRQEVNSLTRLK